MGRALSEQTLEWDPPRACARAHTHTHTYTNTQTAGTHPPQAWRPAARRHAPPRSVHARPRMPATRLRARMQVSELSQAQVDR